MTCIVAQYLHPDGVTSVLAVVLPPIVDHSDLRATEVGMAPGETFGKVMG